MTSSSVLVPYFKLQLHIQIAVVHIWFDYQHFLLLSLLYKEDKRCK
jgi:hypothetical protein